MATSKINIHPNHLGISPGIFKKYEDSILEDSEMMRIDGLIQRYEAARVKLPCDEMLVKLQQQLKVNRAELAMVLGVGMTSLKDSFKGIPVSRERRAILRAHLDCIPILDAILLEEQRDISTLSE